MFKSLDFRVSSIITGGLLSLIILLIVLTSFYFLIENPLTHGVTRFTEQSPVELSRAETETVQNITGEELESFQSQILESKLNHTSKYLNLSVPWNKLVSISHYRILKRARILQNDVTNLKSDITETNTLIKQREEALKRGEPIPPETEGIIQDKHMIEALKKTEQILITYMGVLRSLYNKNYKHLDLLFDKKMLEIQEKEESVKRKLQEFQCELEEILEIEERNTQKRRRMEKRERRKENENKYESSTTESTNSTTDSTNSTTESTDSINNISDSINNISDNTKNNDNSSDEEDSSELEEEDKDRKSKVQSTIEDKLLELEFLSCIKTYRRLLDTLVELRSKAPQNGKRFLENVNLHTVNDVMKNLSATVVICIHNGMWNGVTGNNIIAQADQYVTEQREEAGTVEEASAKMKKAGEAGSESDESDNEAANEVSNEVNNEV